MIHLLEEKLQKVNDENGEHLPWVYSLWDKEGDQVVAYRRGKLIFVFNWNGQKSFPDYGFLAPEGSYKVVLNTDAKEFAGFGQTDDSITHFTQDDPLYRQEQEWNRQGVTLPGRPCPTGYCAARTYGLRRSTENCGNL